MKFGLFILPSWPEVEPSYQSRILHKAIEQIQNAEELGFDAVWLAEHHFNRQRDGLPGEVTLWRGMQTLSVLVEGVHSARKLTDLGS
jgi:alkanesulfonate monooxygenase SsuD/methylene tetrahydromethanopterin reductase-like flavin-dependent oxidoreductase (luciferase family)